VIGHLERVQRHRGKKATRPSRRWRLRLANSLLAGDGGGVVRGDTRGGGVHSFVARIACSTRDGNFLLRLPQHREAALLQIVLEPWHVRRRRNSGSHHAERDQRHAMVDVMLVLLIIFMVTAPNDSAGRESEFARKTKAAPVVQRQEDRSLSELLGNRAIRSGEKKGLHWRDGSEARKSSRKAQKPTPRRRPIKKCTCTPIAIFPTASWSR